MSNKMKVPATKIYFSEEDIKFIIENFKGILRGNSFLSTYKFCEEFEKNFAAYIKTDFAVACNSGTSALEMICRAVGVDGKEVIMPSNTFIATANAILNAGGIPVFADCADDMCMDAIDAISKITEKTIAIMHVHIGGIVSRSALHLKKECEARGIYLFEDAAQAHGSSLAGIKAGAFGKAAGFSFFSTKVMTTGEGGMVTTSDLNMIPKLRSIREFGKEKTGIYINYHTSIGYNWRMPEVAALMGIRQLMSIDKFIKRRQEIAKIYDEELKGHSDFEIVYPEKNSNHNYFKYIIMLKNHSRELVHKELLQKDIQPSGYVYELPLHKQPVFQWAHKLNLPKTEFVCSNHLCLPIFYKMTDEEVLYVAKSLKSILSSLK